MISRRTQKLICLPVTFILFKYLITPAYYDKRQDKLVRSKGIALLNYWLYYMGNIIARFVLMGVLIESVVAGHARGTKDIAMVSFNLPLFIMSAALELNDLIHHNFALYLMNQIFALHKGIGKLTTVFLVHCRNFCHEIQTLRTSLQDIT
jgi:uncharacterized Tic20 family protein